MTLKLKEILPGDRMLVSGGLEGKINHIPVTVTATEPSNCEGGILFHTDPPVGSGNGISGYWFVKRIEKEPE